MRQRGALTDGLTAPGIGARVRDGPPPAQVCARRVELDDREIRAGLE